MTVNLQGLDEIVSIVATEASDVKGLTCPGCKNKHICVASLHLKSHQMCVSENESSLASRLPILPSSEYEG